MKIVALLCTLKHQELSQTALLQDGKCYFRFFFENSNNLTLRHLFKDRICIFDELYIFFLLICFLFFVILL
jgi:hypothetical protein